MLKLLIIQILVVSGGLPWVVFTQDSSEAFSFVSGGLLLILSLAFFATTFGLMFRQKLVALVPALIVSKYAILGVLIVKIVNLDWADPLWLGLGFSTITLGGFLYGLDEALRKTA